MIRANGARFQTCAHMSLRVGFILLLASVLITINSRMSIELLAINRGLLAEQIH